MIYAVLAGMILCITCLYLLFVVSAIKGEIATLKRENVTLASSVLSAKKVAATALSADHPVYGEIAEINATVEGLNQRLLTLENKRPKITAAPKKTTWRNFRSAIERSTEPEEAEENG